MKTSIVVACFSNNKGGMELNSLGLARLLHRQHDVTVVCREGSYIETFRKSLLKDGIELVSIPFAGNLSLRCIFDLRKVLKKKNIKNLIFFGASELKSIVLAKLGLPVQILNFHGTTKTHSKKDPLHKLIYKGVRFHIAVSEHLKKNVLKIIPGSTEENVKVVYLPCDHTNTEAKTLTSPVQVVHVGRIAKGKGHEDCLEVIESVSKTLQVRATFVGGVEDEDISQKLQNKMYKHPELAQIVHFAGFQTNVQSYLTPSHFLVFPSRGEGLPNTLIEAFLAKVLPITYDNTVFPEFLKLGFEFPQVSDGDLEALKALCKTTFTMDPELFSQKVENNYKLAEKYFSGDSVLKSYNELLQ
jgi:glycosyltransferase involved in cell wall biosynthesis